MVTYNSATSNHARFNGQRSSLSVLNSLEHIYVLRLEKHRWYIGKGRDPQARFEAHCNGSGTPWTQLFRPIELVLIRPSTSGTDEDNTTIEYMAQHGIDNVRGGTICQLVLNPRHNPSLSYANSWVA